MTRRLAALIAALAMIAGIFAVSGAPSAQAATERCHKLTSKSGYCFSVSNSTRQLQVMQRVILENKRKKKGTSIFHCTFSDTLTRTLTGSVSLTVGAKADILAVAEVSTSINLSLSLSQSASTAVGAAADVPLKRGERVECQRTYGYLHTRVTEMHYSNNSVYTTQYWVSIPIAMGVRVKDL